MANIFDDIMNVLMGGSGSQSRKPEPDREDPDEERPKKEKHPGRGKKAVKNGGKAVAVIKENINTTVI